MNSEFVNKGYAFYVVVIFFMLMACLFGGCIEPVTGDFGVIDTTGYGRDHKYMYRICAEDCFTLFTNNKMNLGDTIWFTSMHKCN